MKRLFFAIVTSMLLLTAYAHAQHTATSQKTKSGKVVKKSYCQENPAVCRRAKSWCAKHVGTKRACKQPQEVYCRTHAMKCKSGN